MIPSLRQFVAYLIWNPPSETLTAVTVLGVLGVAASAGVSALAGRRREARTLAMEGMPLACAFLLFCLFDWGLQWALPRLQLSFAPTAAVILAFTFFVRLLVFWGLLAAALLARWRGRRRGLMVQTRSAAILFLAANLGLTAVQVDAYVIEPLWIETTEVSLASHDLRPDAPPLRVVHLTDTHIERYSFREEAAVEKVNALEPDIVVFTGDYLNTSYRFDPTAIADLRRFVARIDAPYGIYGVRGSVEPAETTMAELIEGTSIVWLEQKAVTVDVRGQRVTLVGVACSHQQELDVERLDRAMERVRGDTFTLLLFHSPDLILEAAGHGVDLYLAGHTHGGQIRLPVYGAVITMSRYGKRYASGQFQVGATTMIVSRGLGFEGGGLPRARFLCRPEIVSLDIGGVDVSHRFP